MLVMIQEQRGRKPFSRAVLQARRSYLASLQAGAGGEATLRSFSCPIAPVLAVGRDLPIRTGAIRVSANTSILGKLTGAEGI
jgi:hypothetical protein